MAQLIPVRFHLGQLVLHAGKQTAKARCDSVERCSGPVPPPPPFRLHGTNEPETIGEKVSSGCIRLFNHDIIDLYDRVSVGAPVVVLQEARESFRADAEADDLYSPAAPEPPWPGFEPD